MEAQGANKPGYQESLDSAYEQMVGIDVVHYYLGILRPGERIEIKFLNLPDFAPVLDADGFESKLPDLLRTYLMKKHDTQNDEEKESFAGSITSVGSILGFASVMHPARVLLGFVKLR